MSHPINDQIFESISEEYQIYKVTLEDNVISTLSLQLGMNNKIWLGIIICPSFLQRKMLIKHYAEIVYKTLSLRLHNDYNNMETYQHRDICVHCGKNTSYGHPDMLFVDRIPADADLLDDDQNPYWS